MTNGTAGAEDAAQRLADRMAQIAVAAHHSNVARVTRLRTLLDAGLGADQRVEAADLAHKLAGSAGTFGYTRVSDQARDLEAYLNPEQDSEDADPFASDSAEERDTRVRGWLDHVDRLLAEEPDEID